MVAEHDGGVVSVEVVYDDAHTLHELVIVVRRCSQPTASPQDRATTIAAVIAASVANNPNGETANHGRRVRVASSVRRVKAEVGNANSVRREPLPMAQQRPPPKHRRWR